MDALTDSMKDQIRLAVLADRVWFFLTHDTEPMPAMVALDWLRQESGVEDVGMLKKAIRIAASRTLKELPNELWPRTSEVIRIRLEEGNFLSALQLVTEIKLEANEWGRQFTACLPWCAEVEHTVAICQEIQALPE